MNTLTKSFAKRVISMLLVTIMVFSLGIVGLTSASAANVELAETGNYQFLNNPLFYFDNCDRGFLCDYANILRDKNMFDRVMTFDPDDAKEFNMQFHFTPYSKIESKHANEDFQLYFCGSNSERVYPLYQIWSKAKKMEFLVKYDLLGCEQFKPFFENDPNIHFHNKYVEYPELINNMQVSSCILDITRSNQSGYTLRPYEAVVYNKKLLTNNKRIFEFPFYDERYMKYFDDIESIDWSWLKAPITVNYEYKDEFSPAHLIHDAF